jgi:hypothetical protein
MGLKTQLDEARQQWHTAKNAHLRQIELMEVIKGFFCPEFLYQSVD